MIVVVVAEESAGAQALRLTAERGHDVAAVLTTRAPEAETGTPEPGGTAGAAPVAAAAAELRLDILDPLLVRDPTFGTWIADHDVDLLLNVHSLQIAHGEVVAAPRIGSFNLHPGPLPGYAGLNAPSWAIYEGETRHAVTLHWMSATVDAGAIAYEAWFDIGPADTGLQVATTCVRQGVPLVGRLLDDAARGADHIPATPQDPEGRRWWGRRPPHGGRVPWDLPARRIVDLVRASNYAPFPSPWGWPAATLDGREIEIVRASLTGEPADAPPGTVGEARPRGVLVAAADDCVLIERLRVGGAPTPPGKVLSTGRRFAS
ncbi:MAG TPA: formyltransferase family protein [Acidimicrobiales bacterium]|nr:formyltransferase family protein [Acidimicrobiales bacterium]